MSQRIAEWIADFLGHRELTCPDTRALYAYRCTGEEFASLAEALSYCPPHGGGDYMTVRAFVLYAAEWWQRRYDGGRWAWEPLLESIDWRWIHYPDLYEPVRKALRWWKVDLVRLPSSIRYLGTFACQGGLPLALVGYADSSVARFLRAVLEHTAAYRRFVDDPIVLAQDQQHLLRPPTLRRDYVFRLAADIIEAVLDLQSDAQDDEDPLAALDQARREWRRTMPLDLEDERARNLLTGLLRQAARDRISPVNDFRVERFLRQTGVGWRLGARVRLPASVSADSLALQLGVSTADLPLRLEVRTHGERVRVVGLYAVQGDDFVLAPETRSPTELWDTEAAGEIRLGFLAGGQIGEHVVPHRGSALGELPWVFRGDDDGSFIGEGSVANRSPEIFVLVPDGCTPDRGKPLTGSSWKGDEESAGRPEVYICILDRVVWRVSELTTIETDSGRCVIRPSSSQAAEEEYLLAGQRFYDFESPWPLFRGSPTLRVARAEQAPRAVPAREVSWRQTGGEWQPHLAGFGLWEVRHVRDGELRHLGRVGVLPGRFSLSIEPGSDLSQGLLVLNEAGAVRVSGSDSRAVVTTRMEGDEVRIQVTARDAFAPPVRVQLRLHWQGALTMAVQAPFPGHGGRFLQNGRLLDQVLAVDDVYGVRATALSPNNTERFRIEGVLKAPDLGGLLRVAYFNRPLHKVGVAHELALVDVRRMLELLLAASSSSDASVTLRIVDRYQHVHGTARISRFAAALEYDPDTAFVSVSSTLCDETPAAFEALPISRLGGAPVPLDVAGSALAPYGAALPQDINLNEPWLVVMRHDDRIRVRPVAVGGRSACPGIGDTDTPRLSEALGVEDPELRAESIAAAMDAMLEHEGTERGEEEWSFLTDALLLVGSLPATALDVPKVLVTKPKLLVRCLFRLESGPRQILWRLDDELPFSWLTVRRDIWWTEAKQAFDQLREQLSGVIDGDPTQIASEHVGRILTEGADRLRALYTVSTDVDFRLEGGGVSSSLVAAVLSERDRCIPEQIRVRASLNDWPEGDCRKEWRQELEHGQVLYSSNLWQDPNEHRARQPIFDTPVAAAWCCFFVSKPSERTTFLVKRIRAHDPDWFDVAYSAAWFQLARMVDLREAHQ